MAALRAEKRGEARAAEEAVERAESSVGRGARRTIFLVRRVERGSDGSEKGGLRMPSLGVIMNFWFSGGMARSAWILEERSMMVASGEKGNVCGVPWWVNVRCIFGSVEAGGLSDGMVGLSTSVLLDGKCCKKGRLRIK